MSQFVDQVQKEILNVVKEHGVMKQDRGVGRVQPSVPLDLTSRLPPNLTEMGVGRVISSLHEDNAEQEAKKILAVYSASALLYCDGVLEKLDLVGTPEDTPGRLQAITRVIDLNRQLKGEDNFSEGLIGTMSTYWDQIPLFFDDLPTVFNVIAEFYQDDPNLKLFTSWCRNYAFRDGILGVTEKLLTEYGDSFNEDLHKGDFGIKYQRNRFALTGVSTEDYMSALCSLNRELADAGVWPYHIKELDVRGGSENWKTALLEAKDRTLGKTVKREESLAERV